MNIDNDFYDFHLWLTVLPCSRVDNYNMHAVMIAYLRNICITLIIVVIIHVCDGCTLDAWLHEALASLDTF